MDQGTKEAIDRANLVWATIEDARLRAALESVNQAIDPEWPDARLVEVRDQIWAIGVERFQWAD